jgi:oligopeptide/dipeptide ABC transporter ATP-binding protein
MPDTVVMPDTAAPADDRANPVLEITRLRVEFDTAVGPVQVVRDVSVQIHAGETVGIVGESGSGKSTLALAIIGLLPPNGRLAAGTIRLGDVVLSSLSQPELRRIRGRRVGMVFQDSMSSLNPLLPIGTQITEVMEQHLGMSRAAAREQAVELLREVGVPEPRRRLRQLPHQLSGGLRQRVAIAIALAADPEVLIADEPTTALDVTVQSQLLDLIEHEQAARSMAVLVITHDHGVVARMCDRVAVMYAGRVVETGPVDALFDDPRHPYTLGLQASVPRLDTAMTGRLASIHGTPPRLDALPAGCPFAPRCPYRVERCEVEDPPLGSVTAAEGHRAACWVDVRVR